MSEDTREWTGTDRSCFSLKLAGVGGAISDRKFEPFRLPLIGFFFSLLRPGKTRRVRTRGDGRWVGTAARRRRRPSSARAGCSCSSKRTTRRRAPDSASATPPCSAEVSSTGETVLLDQVLFFVVYFFCFVVSLCWIPFRFSFTCSLWLHFQVLPSYSGRLFLRFLVLNGFFKDFTELYRVLLDFWWLFINFFSGFFSSNLVFSILLSSTFLFCY